ncbi:alpha/beta hydrolase [Xanthobacter autotrophicus]|uniref:alpha/beta hydrolase n=1 Tax=Xanthobacter autotrophicus TaxID=280 RepID=UPI0024A688D0|nr:alpha/beta hydrolase [Xanthobacter autotrophicus]MDI4658826.1 alpha/beta hydrolase [Xanthobacter autotrophicus]
MTLGETTLDEDFSHLEVGDRAIAVRALAGVAPGLFWLGGFKSDMTGTKAEHLARWAADHGRANVRFDYSGHGTSGGAFEDGTISRWLEEAVAVFDARTQGDQVVIGSSMGGWIALLLARLLAKRGETRLKGLVLVAPAPDFTEDLMRARFAPEVWAQIETTGRFERPSAYGDGPYVITRALIEDGRRHLLLGAPFAVGCPVRILQGAQDEDVPWQHAMRLVSCLAEDDVVFSLIKDGDHRLSRPEDLERLTDAVAELA